MPAEREDPRASRAGAFLGAAATVLVSLVLALLSVELGLRLFWDGFYYKEDQPYAQAHPTRGWANRPDIEFAYGEAEFSEVVSHNSRGYRSSEISQHKPSGVERVLVLGDSFTWGVGVANDQTFSARMQAADPRLEVVNTGVNGYGTSQELRLLLEDGLPLAPDLVLVAFFWNDVQNSYRHSVPSYELRDGKLHYEPPALTVSGGGGAELAPLRRRVFRWSYAYRFSSDRIKLLRYRVKAALGVPLEESDFIDEDELEQAWDLERALLREIVEQSRAHGAKVAIAIIPEEIQVQPETPVIGLEERDYDVQERLLAFGRDAQVSVIDLLPALRQAHRTSGEPLYYAMDRHLNSRGHELVAGELLRALRELHELPALDSQTQARTQESAVRR